MTIEDIGADAPTVIALLDWSVVDMIRGHLGTIRAMFGADLWEADISWDYPAQLNGDLWTEADAKLSHAIGFICGCAALADVTPLEFCDVIDHMAPSPNEKRAAVDVPAARAINGDPAYDGVALQRGAMARILHPKETAERKRATRKTSQRRQKIRKIR